VRSANDYGTKLHGRCGSRIRRILHRSNCRRTKHLSVRWTNPFEQDTGINGGEQVIGGVLPRLTGAGLLDYMALAAGLVVGFALFSAPATQIGDAISKN